MLIWKEKELSVYWNLGINNCGTLLLKQGDHLSTRDCKLMNNLGCTLVSILCETRAIIKLPFLIY